MGYLTRWQNVDASKVDEYVHLIHDAFNLRYGVAILRLQDGFDITDEVLDDEIENGVVENHEPDWYTEDWDENQKDSPSQQGMDIFGAKYSRMDQVKFVEDSLYRTLSDMVC